MDQEGGVNSVGAHRNPKVGTYTSQHLPCYIFRPYLKVPSQLNFPLLPFATRQACQLSKTVKEDLQPAH